MGKLIIFNVLFVYLCLSATAFPGNSNQDKPRLLVLTDIGGDPDDIQSLIRLLVYANEFRIKGIIATATWGSESRHYGKYYIFENLIHDVIEDYKHIRDNLLLHAVGYPTADELHSVVRGGQANRGADKLSPGLSTTGSQHIIHVVDASDEPLYVLIWGGAHDLAQTLTDVRSTRTSGEVEKFISKVRVYAINDQDKKFHQEGKGTGEWIKENFPSLRYVESGPPWMSIFSAVYRGMYQNDSREGDHSELPLVEPGVEQLNNIEWLEANVFSWGALGEGYPSSITQNPNTPRNTKGVKEGDAPSWFFVLPNGLNDPEHPEWGGWGGRFEHHNGGHYTDAQDDHWSGEIDAALRRKWTVARWREAYQNDFAGRMRWCKLSYNEANHNPVAVIEGDSTRAVLYRTVQSGKNIYIDAGSSYDPDENQLNFNWWIYHEASSTSAIVRNNHDGVARIETYETSHNGDIHVILEVTDDGTPQLYTYRRIILKVLPKE